MFEVKVLGGFASAHYLREYKGKCENMHGHNYKIEAVVSAVKLNNIGLAVDFGDVKAALHEITETLDHKVLDELAPFKKANPSAENISKHIYAELKKKVKLKGVKVARVSVWETERSCATYFE